MRVRHRGAALGLALVALVAGGASPASGAEKAIWGPTVLPNGHSAFPLYARLGVDTFQAELRWEQVAFRRPANPTNPKDPAYHWPGYIDRAIKEGRKRGIRVLLRIYGSPSWSNGDKTYQYAPDDPKDLAAFSSAAARRYPAVKRWMIWNEPNMGLWFRPQEANKPTSARIYARMLDAAYGGIKSVSRSDIVIGGDTWTGGDVKPVDFLRYLRLPDGTPPRLDWWGHNPFPFRFPDPLRDPIGGGFRDMSDVDTFDAEVRRTYASLCRPSSHLPCAATGGPPLWLSEFTIQTSRASKLFRNFVSERSQGRWIKAAWGIADASSHVKGMGWFALLDEPSSVDGHANWGLMSARGKPKPGLEAFKLAPSVRLSPSVRVASPIGRGALAHGIVVHVRPRAAGLVTVKLRVLGGRVLGTFERTAKRAGVTIPIQVTHSLSGPARLVLETRAARGARVRTDLHVR